MTFFLCLDPNHSLEEILEDYSTLFGFTYEIAESVATFTAACASRTPTACILVEQGSLDAIRELLEKQRDQTNCLIVDTSNSAALFRSLKDELGVSYVLQQPIDRNEIAALLRKLCNLDEAESATDRSLPPELVAKYQASIFDKLITIEQEIAQAHSSPDELVTLRNSVHKIAGSAGAYGYGGVGTLCKAHELFLMNTSLQEHMEASNNLFLRRLKLAFQNICLKQVATTSAGGVAEREQAQPAETSTFLTLVSDDMSLVHLFQKIAAQRELAINVESSPQKFLERSRSLPREPHALITEESFPFTSFTGLEVIERAKEHWDQDHLLYGLLTHSDELDKRMEWLNQGVDLTLKKPLTQENISHIFDQVATAKKLKELKALIVEDDPDVGAIEVAALEQLGVEAHLLQDETQLIHTLEEQDPDIVILDINLPRYNGRELLQTLRSDIRFCHLIIVVVTAVVEENFTEWAYGARCDEVISKPIDIPHFQARILNLARRHVASKSEAKLDPTTGLYPREHFLTNVHELVAKSTGLPAAFTLLNIDHWNSLSTELTPQEVKTLLIQVAELIKSHFTKGSLIGYLNGGSFGLLFLNLLGGEIEIMMDAFFTEVAKQIHLMGRENIKITLSSSTSLFAVGKIAIGTAIGETEKHLTELLSEGTSHKTLNRLTPSDIHLTEQNRIILVDDDKDLCAVVSGAFRNHGFEAHTFHTGEDAINYFAKLDTLTNNTLIILDRILPDRDGLTLLKLIREKFPGKVKAIFLSSLSTEKDVLEGLKSGALDYIAKPFSISVLLQKALLLLNP